MKKLHITMIGGDLRQVCCAAKMAEDGHFIKGFGLPGGSAQLKGIIQSPTLEDALDGSDIVILPLPATKNNQFLNLPSSEEPIAAGELFQNLGKHQIVLGGMFDEKTKKLAEAYNLHVIDYFNREELSVLNAVPTAEGVLQIALEELPITLHSASCLVIGFGRIGKLTAADLKGVGAQVTVAARRYDAAAWIKSLGYRPIYFDRLGETLGQYDLIVNTVPHLVLDGPRLEHVRQNCLVIDVASKPGGVDFKKAKELGKNVIWALSLPGKVAPVTAGEMIQQTIYHILEELGVSD